MAAATTKKRTATDKQWKQALSKEAQAHWYLDLTYGIRKDDKAPSAAAAPSTAAPSANGNDAEPKLVKVDVLYGTLAADGFHVIKQPKTDPKVSIFGEPLRSKWIKLGGFGKVPYDPTFAEEFTVILSSGASDAMMSAFPDTIERQIEYMRAVDDAMQRLRELLMYNPATRALAIHDNFKEKVWGKDALKAAFTHYRKAGGGKLNKKDFTAQCVYNNWETPEKDLIAESQVQAQMEADDLLLEWEARQVYREWYRARFYAEINGATPNRYVNESLTLAKQQKQTTDRHRFEQDPGLIRSRKVWMPAREGKEGNYYLTDETAPGSGKWEFSKDYEAYLNHCSHRRSQEDNDKLLQQARATNKLGEYHLKYNRPLIKVGKNQEIASGQDKPTNFTDEPFRYGTRVADSSNFYITLPPGKGINIHYELGPVLYVYEWGEDMPLQPVPDMDRMLIVPASKRNRPSESVSDDALMSMVMPGEEQDNDDDDDNVSEPKRSKAEK